MITLFACPKPFRGHIDVIQRNAIKSWTLLRPKPEIILAGHEEGVSEISEEFDLVHIPDVEKNEYGTPLVNSVFQICQARARHSTVCYVNSDIILMDNFMRSVATVCGHMPKYLMIGQRWDMDIVEALAFAADSWERDLQAQRTKTGELHGPSAMDYFVFPRGMYTDIPPLAIGRLAWDNWLVWRARSMSISVVDATAAVTIVHQNHDYAASIIQTLVDQELESVSQEDSFGALRRFDGRWVKLGPEARRNDALVPEDIREFGVWAATWMLDRQFSLKRRPISITPAYLKYQIKWILPLYSPRLGRVVRRMLAARKTLQGNLGRHLFLPNIPGNQVPRD